MPVSEKLPIALLPPNFHPHEGRPLLYGRLFSTLNTMNTYIKNKVKNKFLRGSFV